MDFKRIEIIFLCAFFSLNIFLYLTYQQGHSDLKTATNIDTVAAIETRLKSDRIGFEKDFSKEIKQGYYLSAESTDFAATSLNTGDLVEHQQLLRTFPPSKDLVISKSQPEKEISQFISQNTSIYKHQDYTYLNLQDSDPTKYTASQVFEGIPFNDETTELILEVKDSTAVDLMIRGFTQTHLTGIEPLREAQDIIPECDAIETLYMSNKIPPEGKILKTQLAYTRLFTVREKNVYIPAWFVWIENNKKNVQVERVNGFSNSIISASVPDVKK